MRDVLVVDSVRTGLAKSFRGSFNWTRSDDMAAFLIDALIDRNPQFDPGEVEDVILGAANQSGEQGGNLHAWPLFCRSYRSRRRVLQ